MTNPFRAPASPSTNPFRAFTAYNEPPSKDRSSPLPPSPPAYIIGGSTRDLIADNAAENARLLSVLTDTDYAAPALSQQNAYVTDLTQELTQTDKYIKELTTKREKELKDHEKYRDSTLRRFAYRLGGKKEKFEEKATKEEQEYFQALHDEHKAKERREMLQLSLDEAVKRQGELQAEAARNKAAQDELDRLYQRIFDGPTPEFPEEDRMEVPVQQAMVVYNDLQQRVSASVQAQQILNEAEKTMRDALRDMANALDASTMDMWGVGGGFADYMERSDLSRAESKAHKVQSLMRQAQERDRGIQEVGTVKISQGNILSDIVFDNIFSDMAFHDKIKASDRQMRVVHRKIGEQLKMAMERGEDLRGRLREATRNLEATRKELQRVRQDAFARVLEERNGARSPGF